MQQHQNQREFPPFGLARSSGDHQHDFFVMRNVNSYVSNQYDYVLSHHGCLLADSQGVDG
jgi:hypothetical protein